METLKISKNQLSIIGDHSLEGMIYRQFDTIPKELRIEFEQSENKRPEKIKIPEYVPMVLCQSILSLSKQCEKVEIGEY
jgi:hypothetical protein